VSSDKVNHYLLRRWFCLICLLVYHILPVLSLVIHYISIHPCHQHYSCNKKIQGLGFLVLHWQIENFLDSANRCGIAGVLIQGAVYRHTNELSVTVRTFMRSSLIFTQGAPFTEAILMTMFSALLLSIPPLEYVRKSFVRYVPIPNVAKIIW
jgi:hypothetical protein